MSAQSSSSSASSASSGHLLELRFQRLTEELAAADRALADQQREVDELVARQGQARESVRRLLHALPTPVVSTDADGAVEDCNPAASALLGVTAEALVSTPVQAFVAAEDRPAARSLLSRAGREGTAAGQLRLQPRDGADREVQAVVSAFSTAVGEQRLVVLLPSTTADAGATAVHGEQAQPSRTAADPGAAAALRSLARLVELAGSGAPGHQLLGAVASAVVVSVPGATSSSACTGDPGQPTDSAADSAEAQTVDGAQWAADEGPAFHAHASGEPVVSDDLASDERWPRLARRLAAAGVSSVVAVPLRVEGGVTGVVSAYGGAGGDVDADRAMAFAEGASAVLETAHRMAALRSEVENLKLAMQSRAAIEQAKGAVASRLDCTVEEAFAAMVVMSQDRNVKVRDIGVLVAASPSDTSLDAPLRIALERARQRAGGQPRP